MDHGQLLTDLCNVLWEHAGGFKLIIPATKFHHVAGVPNSVFEEREPGHPLPLDYLAENEQHMHLSVDAWGVRATLSFKQAIVRVEVPWTAVRGMMSPSGDYQMAIPALSHTPVEEEPEQEEAPKEQEPAKVLEFKPRGT
jgi:hypothetical protein